MSKWVSNGAPPLHGFNEDIMNFGILLFLTKKKNRKEEEKD
jgi:hypothetical protein